MVVSTTTAALIAFGVKIGQGIIKRRAKQKLKLDERRGLRGDIRRMSSPMYQAVRDEYGREMMMKFDQLVGMSFDISMRGAGGHWQGLDEVVPGGPSGGGIKSISGNKHGEKMQALQVLREYWATVADAAVEYEQERGLPLGKASLLAAYVAYRGSRAS